MGRVPVGDAGGVGLDSDGLERDDLLDLFHGGEVAGRRQNLNADSGAIIARARRKTSSPSAHPGSLEAGRTARSSAPVQDLPSVSNARDQYSWEIRNQYSQEMRTTSSVTV
ncbi:hypothetical protein [Streptomyces sp. NPDC020362]|uniref:hypothetical protein n=1 Tax=unclassified Streptomyces TaxID=2593676 RepID=UPI0033D36584